MTAGTSFVYSRLDPSGYLKQCLQWGGPGSVFVLCHQGTGDTLEKEEHRVESDGLSISVQPQDLGRHRISSEMA